MTETEAHLKILAELSSLKSQVDRMEANQRRIETAQKEIRKLWDEFKDTAFQRSAACQKEIHSRINQTNEKVAKILGRHEMENEKPPELKVRQSDTKRGLLATMDTKDRIFFMLLGMMLAKQVAEIFGRFFQ